MFLLKKSQSHSKVIPQASPPTPPPPPLYKKMTLCVDKACFVLIAGLEFLQVDLETGIIKKLSMCFWILYYYYHYYYYYSFAHFLTFLIDKDEYEGSPVARYYDVYGLVGFIELLTG